MHPNVDRLSSRNGRYSSQIVLDPQDNVLLDKVNILESPFYGAYPLEWSEVPCQRPFGGRGRPLPQFCLYLRHEPPCLQEL